MNKLFNLMMLVYLGLMIVLYAHGFIYDFDAMYNSFIIGIDGMSWYILGGMTTSAIFVARSLVNNKKTNENYIFGIIFIGMIWPLILITMMFMVVFKKDKKDKIVKKTE